MRKIVPVLFMLLLLMAACGGESEATPFPFTPTPQAALRKNQAFPVTLPDLLANPPMYRDALVQVTGRYERRPLLVCENAAETYPSPAAWVLRGENGVVVNAGGYDDTLRALLPDELTITVNGYWEEWQGIVGCGQQAESTTLWYLRVTDVVSPSPLAQVTLTPGGVAADGGNAGDTAVNPQLPEVTPTAGAGGGIPTATPGDGGMPMPTIPVGTVTPTPKTGLSGTATPVSGGAATPTPTFTSQPGITPTTAVTPSPAGSTSTPAGPTATPAGSATAAPGGTPTTTPNPLATATQSPADLTEVVMDDVYPEDIFYGPLGSGEKHSWDLVLDDSSVITVSVAAEPQMRLNFAVMAENGSVVVSQEVSGGTVGTAAGVSVDPAQFYTLEIFAPDGSTGNYAIVLWGNDVFALPNEAQDFLDYGQVGSAVLPADGASHYWFFYGQAGEVVNIVTSPPSDRLILVSLYDAQGDVVVDGNGNDVELVDNEALGVSLPETGLYAIWLIENDFQSTSYTIQVSRN